MSVALITHPACLEHDTGPWHPECADRLRAVLRALEGEEFLPLLRELAPAATRARPQRACAWRAATAALEKKQNPMACARSA